MGRFMQTIKKYGKIEYLYVFLLFFVSIPLFAGFLDGNDTRFHLMRIEGITEGLRMGQFPVKIQPAWYDGYGYGCSVFYGDLFLYLPACLHLAGVSLQGAYQFYIFLVQAATITVSAYSFRRIFEKRFIALFGTTLYTLSIYRLKNVFARGAVGEYTAMVFLPLLAYALVLLLKKDSEKKELWKGTLLLAFGMTGILQSHLLSAEMVCIMLAFLCIVYLRRILKAKVFGAFVKAVCLAAALNLGFLVPFADYMVTGKFNVNAINGGWRVEQNIQECGAGLSQLAGIFYRADSKVPTQEMGGIGLGLLAAVAVFMIFLFLLKKEEKNSFCWKLARISCVIAVLSVFMSTRYFPWEALRKSNVLVRYIVINLQFPWRFCTVASIALTVLWCCLLQLMASAWSVRGALAAAGATATVSLITAGYFAGDTLRVGQSFQAVFAEGMDTMVESGEEYLPVNTVSRDFSEENLYVGEGITVSETERTGIRLKITCVNQSKQEQEMEVPLLYYKGYSASGKDLDGTKKKLTVGSGNNQVVRIQIPAGFDGIITIDFKEPLYWRIAEGISLMAVFLTIYLAYAKIWNCNKKYAILGKSNETKTKLFFRNQ